MRVLLFFSVIFLFWGCSYYEEESISYTAPNWTSDNKVIFIEVYWYQKYRRSFFGTSDLVENREIGYLWEVDTNQSYRRICKLWESEYNIGATNISSAGEWVVIGYGNGEIWLIKRDGSNLHKLTNGKYPDFSPDAKKIVFVRNDGLYVINRDGSGEKRIYESPISRSPPPVWSSIFSKIAFNPNYEDGFILDTLGNIIDTLYSRIILDWGISDTDKILGFIFQGNKSVLIDLNTYQEDTLSFSATYWSPNGLYFIGSDVKGWYVCNFNGQNKWYIKP